MKRDNPRHFDLLLRLSRAGNQKAFAELYELWAEKIYRFCFRQTGDRELAADLTSEVFLKIWQNLPGFGGDHRNFPAWTYRIARSCVSDYFRRNRVVPLVLEELPEIAEEKDPFEHFDVAFDAKLEGALQSLSDEFRRAIELRYIKGLAFGQIAKRLHKKEGTVRTLISRALRALRQKLVK